MSTTAGEQLRPFYDLWRARYPLVFTKPLVVREDSTDAAFHIESGVVNGQPWVCVRRGYGPIMGGQAAHEIMGHMLRRILGDEVWAPFWLARFAGCASAPKLADHLLDPLVVNGTWAFLPIEIFAEAARIAFDPDSPIDANTASRDDRSMDWGCDVDGPKMRAFFEKWLGVAMPPTVPTPTSEPAVAVNGKGCDIASYQGTVDFDLLKTEVAFVIAKSSEGTGYRDPTFPRNWSEAKRVGLVRGAYHFARPDLGTDAQDEAAYFLSSINPVDPGDLLALDYEVQWDGDVVGWCHSFLNLVRQMTGNTPLIYLNLSLVRGHDWTPVISDGYPLWLAAYDGQPDVVPATPWPSLAIKQWSSSGTLAGVPGRVDLNTAFGGGEDLNRQETLDLIEEKYGLTNTVAAVKEALKGQAEAITKLANDETLDDADVAELTARIDKLRTI
jgi:GH25 family lysozyme M1 (1,4-beta-N-acetylmuramidase)